MEMPNIPWVTDKQIPTVDPADLKALHKLHTDLNADCQPGTWVTVGLRAVQKVLTPGADVGILSYRLGWLPMLQGWSQAKPEEFPWIKGDKIDDAVFSALAVLPLTGISAGGTSTPPFDPDELVRLILKLKKELPPEK